MAMDCPKCQGLMVRERLSDYFHVCYAWKCLNCGAVIHPQGTQDQAQQSSPHLSAHIPR
jgi:DNA-directed RNA polymerase subunit M/transcription elongation factor TFIIS